VVGSHAINGLSRQHTEILQTSVFPDYARLFPRRFTNKTVGVTPRRWLLGANPQLSALITSAIGDGWGRDLSQLHALEPFADDASFREQWRRVRLARKELLDRWLRSHHRLDIDPEWQLDVQTGPIHEHKRQLLNAMHVLATYHRLLGGEDTPPRTVVFAGKAPPTYHVAKLIIKLIHDIKATLDANPFVAQRLNVVFIPNYNVSSAEMLFPATDLFQHLATNGTEACSTGCMKAIMNGAVLVGSHGAAGGEIREQVGDENIFSFGLAATETSKQPPDAFRNAELNAVLERISVMSGGAFRPLVDMLLAKDRYSVCPEFPSYTQVQLRVAEAWLDKELWTRMSILNTARSGYFSMDRSVSEYARDIWFCTHH